MATIARSLHAAGLLILPILKFFYLHYNWCCGEHDEAMTAKDSPDLQGA
jgi:hypothetical protein